MPKVLIFGVNGFVGEYLAKEFFLAGYLVAGCDRSKKAHNEMVSEFFSLDIRDARRVEEAIASVLPDMIVNLAAISSVARSWEEPALTYEINVVGTINILEGVRKTCSDARILLIGSSEEYADSADPLTEEGPVVANNPYGASKLSQENIASIYAERFGLRVYRTRSFNHTGVGQPPSFVIPSWCKQVAEISHSKKPGTVKVGNLNVRRDFSDVRDVVRAYRLLLESPYDGEVFNIGSGHSYLLTEIMETIQSFSDQNINVEVNPALIRPTDNPCIWSDCSKAQRLLRWEPKYSIVDTLRKVYDSFVD